jgi:hypothetical protein
MKARGFSKALIYHLQWKVQFKKFLEGQGHFDIAELSLENCKLGKWLLSEEILKYASRTEIREIEKVHAKLHQRAKRVYALKKLGEDLDARQELKKMETASMKLASLLTTLKAISEN